MGEKGAGATRRDKDFSAPLQGIVYFATLIFVNNPLPYTGFSILVMRIVHFDPMR